MPRGMKKEHNAVSSRDLRVKTFIIFLPKITGGVLNTVPADRIRKCSTSLMFRTAVLTVVPDVHAVNIRSWVMTFLCSMKSIKTVV